MPPQAPLVEPRRSAAPDVAHTSAAAPPPHELDTTSLRNALPTLAPAGWGTWGGSADADSASVWTAKDEEPHAASFALSDSGSDDEALTADGILRAHCDALRCGSPAARDAALAALSALPVVALTDSACWAHVCPALHAALAAPQPARAHALSLLCRLVRAARSAEAGHQLAQLAAVLAWQLGMEDESADFAALLAAALVEADAALRACWQGLRAGTLAELAAARVALLRNPHAMAALAAAEEPPRAWPAAWCSVAPACAALTAALSRDPTALSALAAAALSDDTAAPHERAAAVAALGSLLHASAVRALFPLRCECASATPPAWLTQLGAAYGTAADNALSLPAALGGLVRLAAHEESAAASAPAAAAASTLASLLASPRGGDIAEMLQVAHLRTLAAPLLGGGGDCRVSRVAAVCTSLAECGEEGIAALCRTWPAEESTQRTTCALAAVVAAVVAACSLGGCTAEAALRYHARTLAAAAQCDNVVCTVLLPARLLDALASAHAAADSGLAMQLGLALASFAWTPRGLAALCDIAGAADAAAAALTATAATQLADAAAEGEPLPGTAAWRNERYAASALGAHPVGAAALHAAGWHAVIRADDASAAAAHVAELSPRVLCAACTAVEALLAERDPSCLVAFRRDGSAPAALLFAWLLHGFSDAQRWPDAAGYAALAASRGDAAALVAYPAALLLGPLRGAAARSMAEEGDASGGAGVLPGRLQAAARVSGFTAAGADAAIRELEAHAAAARFLLDAGLSC